MAQLLPILRFELGDRIEPIEGEPGQFLVVPISDLVVDLSYQRSISAHSSRNVQRIGCKFNWRKFAPVIGVRLPDGRIAVIDGQHRCTAALSRGIAEVPVYLMACTLEQAASAFASINGDVTPMSAQDIYRARLAAGDPDAKALQRVLDAADVTIVSVKQNFAVGQTRSIGVLQRCFRVYGADLLTTALQCVTQTGRGNAGLLYGVVIVGIIEALKAKTEWLAKPSELLDIFDNIDLNSIAESAQQEAIRTGNVAQQIVTREINIVLRQARQEAA